MRNRCTIRKFSKRHGVALFPKAERACATPSATAAGGRLWPLCAMTDASLVGALTRVLRDDDPEGVVGFS